MITDYQPTINEVIDASGFKHPGVGLTKDMLENVRTQVREQKEPWNTYFNQMLLSSAAAKTVTSSNQSGTDPAKPGTYAFNSQGVESKFIADSLKAYTQAILYVVTGDELIGQMPCILSAFGRRWTLPNTRILPMRIFTREYLLTVWLPLQKF